MTKKFQSKSNSRKNRGAGRTEETCYRIKIRGGGVNYSAYLPHWIWLNEHLRNGLLVAMKKAKLSVGWDASTTYFHVDVPLVEFTLLALGRARHAAKEEISPA